VEKKFQCVKCHKDFFSYSGKWSHEQKCAASASGAQPPPEEFMHYIIKENQDLKNTMMQIIEKNDEKLMKLVIELCKNTQPTNNTLVQNNCGNNNTTNNSFNLNFFLNETCKDAINLSDFIKTVKVDLNDIETIGQVGYVDGISGIILQRLKDLGIEKRPIHCTDAKRETVYVKENNEWTKEDQAINFIQYLINEVQRINLRQLPLWREKHPTCLQSKSRFADMYNNMSQELMGGDCAKMSIQAKDNKIIKKIVKEMAIDKSAFCLN
jgi:hypothetical protein